MGRWNLERVTEKNKKFFIDGKKIGEKPYIIAEIGFNHGGDLDLAIEMMKSAAACGVDAVKFQTYKASDISLKSSPHYGSVESGELNYEQHKKLFLAAKNLGVTFLSTPFSIEAVDLLEKVGVDAYKVASMDLTNTDLLEYIGKKQKPIILSTGMSTIDEIDEAYHAILKTGNTNIALLHCMSDYPTKNSDANLAMMSTLKEKYRIPVGYSDHTLGTVVPLMSISMGAHIVEKHFTTNKKLEGPDHKISADPSEMKQIVQGAEEIVKIFGTPNLEERPDRKYHLSYRRSYHANKNIKKGTKIDETLIKLVRPGNGLSIKNKKSIVGSIVKFDIVEEQMLAKEHFVTNGQ